MTKFEVWKRKKAKREKANAVQCDFFKRASAALKEQLREAGYYK